ncbi:MAG: hypothetical protein C3F07_21720 [Anaerolineales bacterium]|nr:MAG: hypothetical protein C3F07_21720 [Anaerolineales bacterium]
MDNTEILTILRKIGARVAPNSQLILDPGWATVFGDLIYHLQDNHVDMDVFERVLKETLPPHPQT